MKRNKKLEVLTRDGFKCVRCGRPLYFIKRLSNIGDKKAHIHHIKHKSNGGQDNIENLLSTCWPCECKNHSHNGVYSKKTEVTIIKNGAKRQ